MYIKLCHLASLLNCVAARLTSLPAKPVIKFRLNGIQVDMLFGRAESDTKLREFQQQSQTSVVSQDTTTPSDQPRREYHIDDSDLVGTVRFFFFDSCRCCISISSNSSW